jgi:hypothetical protein
MTGDGAIVVYAPGQCKFLIHHSSSNGCRLRLGWCDIFRHPTPQLEGRFRTSRAQQTRYSKLYGFGRKFPYLCSCKSLQPGATLPRLASILGALSGSTWFVSHKRVISSALTGPLGIASSHPESGDWICKMEGRGRGRGRGRRRITLRSSRGTSEHYPCTAPC